MPPWFRVLAALPEDQVLIPAPTQQLITIFNSGPRGSVTSDLREYHIKVVHRSTCRQNTLTHRIKHK